MTAQDRNTHDATPATEPLALRLSEGLGPNALVERLRAFVTLDGGDIADVEEAADELEQMQATLDGLREMAEDSADRGDVFAQRVLRALGPNVEVTGKPPCGAAGAR